MTNRRKKSKNSPTDAQLEAARIYLEEYSVFRKLFEEQSTKREHFGNPYFEDRQLRKKTADDLIPASILRLKLFERRRFVGSLPPGDEKVFLFLRYVHGEKMEACAAAMGLSVRTVYRLKKRALALAALRLCEFLNSPESTKCYE